MRGQRAPSTLPSHLSKEKPVKHASILATLILTAGLGVAPAPAAPKVSLIGWDDARSVSVEHRDLDLSTPSGVRALHRRIENAVERVCTLPNGKQLAQRVRSADCRVVALRQGLDQAGRVVAEAQLAARVH